MKKLLLTLTAVFLFAALNAQIEQGTIYAGVNSSLGYSSTSIDGADDNVNQFNINLMGGYFFIENLMGGAGLGYNSITQGDFDSSTFNWSLFGRYYINGEFFLGAGYESIKPDGSDATNSVNLTGGYAAFITDDITVEPALNYRLGMGDNDTNTFSLNVGFGLYLR